MSQEYEEERPVPAGIAQITVDGFKSIAREHSIEIRPLTLLAGANSSGKSSMMQPLLLLKQTLEATYDPGPLLLDGPNVRFSSLDQLLSHTANGHKAVGFGVGIADTLGMDLSTRFARDAGSRLRVEQTVLKDRGREARVCREMDQGQIRAVLDRFRPGIVRALEAVRPSHALQLRVVQERCFLDVETSREPGETTDLGSPGHVRWLYDAAPTEDHISAIIHVPGIRGNPERAYSVSGAGAVYPGTFGHYVASVIADWQDAYLQPKLNGLNRGLELLGLTWGIEAHPVDDTRVELRVGRLPQPKGKRRDMVSIADVGFGVSQVLPVLVALLAAWPGQMVYLEQPELHLHPRAQAAMAQVLADAAVRGVRVVAETHSSLLLLAVQALVAEGKLSPDLVKLHWFTRGEDGATSIASADLDEAGAFGDWPEDFGEVALQAESRYLDAAEARLGNNGHAQHSLAPARG